MNWNQDWDYGGNPDGWDDGRCHGIFGTSAANVPRSLSGTFRRVILAVLLIAGFCGAAFQAFQSLRIVARIVNGSHVHDQLHSHKPRVAANSTASE